MTSKLLKKLGIEQVAIHGARIAVATFVALLSQTSDAADIQISDLTQRPTIVSDLGSGQQRALKAVESGEVVDLGLAINIYKTLANRDDALKGLPHHYLKGNATVYGRGRFSPDYDVCFVRHHQHEKTTEDGQYILFADDSPIVYSKKLVDFFTLSHETGHCFFLPELPPAYADHANHESVIFQDNRFKRYAYYHGSLREVQADLVAILDYMRLTSRVDLWTEFLRPFRVGALGVTNHKTAWALDVILKDIDPHALARKSRKDIPQIAAFLMEKHFAISPGQYFPDQLQLDDSGFTGLKPAAQAMYSEILADMTISGQLARGKDELAEVLRKDIHTSVSLNISRYAQIAPASAVGAAMTQYGALAKRFGLERLSFSAKDRPASFPRTMDSFAYEYLGR